MNKLKKPKAPLGFASGGAATGPLGNTAMIAMEGALAAKNRESSNTFFAPDENGVYRNFPKPLWNGKTYEMPYRPGNSVSPSGYMAYENLFKPKPYDGPSIQEQYLQDPGSEWSKQIESTNPSYYKALKNPYSNESAMLGQALNYFKGKQQNPPLTRTLAGYANGGQVSYNPYLDQLKQWQQYNLATDNQRLLDQKSAQDSRLADANFNQDVLNNNRDYGLRAKQADLGLSQFDLSKLNAQRDYDLKQMAADLANRKYLSDAAYRDAELNAKNNIDQQRLAIEQADADTKRSWYNQEKARDFARIANRRAPILGFAGGGLIDNYVSNLFNSGDADYFSGLYKDAMGLQTQQVNNLLNQNKFGLDKSNSAFANQLARDRFEQDVNKNNLANTSSMLDNQLKQMEINNSIKNMNQGPSVIGGPKPIDYGGAYQNAQAAEAKKLEQQRYDQAFKQNQYKIDGDLGIQRTQNDITKERNANDFFLGNRNADLNQNKFNYKKDFFNNASKSFLGFNHGGQPKKKPQDKHPVGKTDVIPAMLTPNEFVLSVPAVAKLGASNLDRFNKDALAEAKGQKVEPSQADAKVMQAVNNLKTNEDIQGFARGGLSSRGISFSGVGNDQSLSDDEKYQRLRQAYETRAMQQAMAQDDARIHQERQAYQNGPSSYSPYADEVDTPYNATNPGGVPDPEIIKAARRNVPFEGKNLGTLNISGNVEADALRAKNKQDAKNMIAREQWAGNYNRTVYPTQGDAEPSRPGVIWDNDIGAFLPGDPATYDRIKMEYSKMLSDNAFKNEPKAQKRFRDFTGREPISTKIGNDPISYYSKGGKAKPKAPLGFSLGGFGTDEYVDELLLDEYGNPINLNEKLRLSDNYRKFNESLNEKLPVRQMDYEKPAKGSKFKLMDELPTIDQDRIVDYKKPTKASELKVLDDVMPEQSEVLQNYRPVQDNVSIKPNNDFYLYNNQHKQLVPVNQGRELLSQSNPVRINPDTNFQLYGEPFDVRDQWARQQLVPAEQPTPTSAPKNASSFEQYANKGREDLINSQRARNEALKSQQGVKPSDPIYDAKRLADEELFQRELPAIRERNALNDSIIGKAKLGANVLDVGTIANVAHNLSGMAKDPVMREKLQGMFPEYNYDWGILKEPKDYIVNKAKGMFGLDDEQSGDSVRNYQSSSTDPRNYQSSGGSRDKPFILPEGYQDNSEPLPTNPKRAQINAAMNGDVNGRTLVKNIEPLKGVQGDYPNIHQNANGKYVVEYDGPNNTAAFNDFETAKRMQDKFLSSGKKLNDYHDLDQNFVVASYDDGTPSRRAVALGNQGVFANSGHLPSEGGFYGNRDMIGMIDQARNKAAKLGVEPNYLQMADLLRSDGEQRAVEADRFRDQNFINSLNGLSSDELFNAVYGKSARDMITQPDPLASEGMQAYQKDRAARAATLNKLYVDQQNNLISQADSARERSDKIHAPAIPWNVMRNSQFSTLTRPEDISKVNDLNKKSILKPYWSTLARAKNEDQRKGIIAKFATENGVQYPIAELFASGNMLPKIDPYATETETNG